MKPDYKPLKELTPNNKHYTIKVKVIHKGSPQKPENKSRYQRLLLQDQEGFKMKATLFNNDIEAFDEALQRNGEYEISNATVTQIPAEHATRPHEHALVINGRTTIDPIPIDPTTLEPQYSTLTSIPRTVQTDTIYDVLGVVLYVNGPKTIPRPQGGQNEVFEFRIIDHSYDRPVVVSLWNEIARPYTQLASEWPNKFAVVAFTALKVRGYKGFTLCSSMSTSILPDPKGPKADALRTWASQHESKLFDLQSKVVQLLAPDAKPVQMSISELQERKAHNTWQDEQFHLSVTFANVTADQLRLYLGCDKCGKRAIAPPPTTDSPFNCKSCTSTETKCVPRAILKTAVTDQSGQLDLTFFTAEVELLTGLPCDTLWNIKDDAEAFEAVITELKEKPVKVLVGPTTALSKSRALFWSARAVELE